MKVLKWVLGSLGVILILIAIFAFVTITKGEAKVAVQYSLEYDDALIPSDSASIALGRYIAESHACQACHKSDFSGEIMVDAPPFTIVPSNLTRGVGGVGASFSDADWLRAIRHGVGQDGRGLLIMPSEAYHNMSDEEVGALIAYLKQVPPVNNELPKTTFKALGKFIMGISEDMKLAPDLLPLEPRMVMPELGPTAEWGKYRASVFCQVCHGNDLLGAQSPDPAAPFAPDLRATQSWGLDGFKKSLREGVTPSNRKIADEFMPWSSIGNLSDVEIEALYAYISTL